MEEQSIPFEAAQAALRQSWEVHRQAFGPILEPAFAEAPQVRIILINALNHISRREIQRGLELLKELNQYCLYDEDKAAWAFFAGLCFEMAGAQKQMLQWYAEAGKYHHRFYLPYLKLAKAAHQDGQLEQAREYYNTAIGCLLEMPDQDEVILGSAYTNLTSCLTLLHQYPGAMTAWRAALDYPQQPGAPATGAILWAALGDREQTESCLKELEGSMPALAPQTRETARQILAGTHPQFPRESSQ